MASSTRTKAPQRGSKGKSGRRLPPKVKSGPEVPLLPVVVAGLLIALFVGLVIYYYINTKPTTVAKVAGIPCDQLEQSKTHYHAALQIIHEGVLTPLPAGIGIQGGESSPTCFYWLHVHAAYPDVIHIESPSGDTFTLGQFLSVWDTWSRNSGRGPVPFDATHVASFTLTAGEKLYVYIDASDGKGPQLFTGDFKSIVLTRHEVISLVISSEATPTPPPPFNWSSSTNSQL